MTRNQREVETAPPFPWQRGAGLIELMLTCTLSLTVLLMALALLQRTNTDFIRHTQSTLLEENGRYAIDLMTRAVRQAGYVDFGNAMPDNLAQMIALRAISIRGADDSGLQGSHSGFDPLPGAAINGSDILAVHFAGSGLIADGSMINCAGFAVARAGANINTPDQGWSIFYVAVGAGGEPELRCKYQGSKQWDSQAIVSGVEGFQVLYGVDTDGDGLPNQYFNASGVSLLDVTDALANRSHWSTVTTIKIALLMRSSRPVNASVWPDRLDLFGPNYAQGNGIKDSGSSVSLVNLPADSRRRLRLVTEAIICLRNSLSGDAVPLGGPGGA